jgi:hypothetical protein
MIADREKNSTSSELILMDHINGSNDLLEQRPIVRSFQNAQDVPHHSANVKEQYDFHDQHTLFYQSVKITNQKKTKKIFFQCLRIPYGQKIDFS